MVKVVKFRNEDDLYSILDDFMNTDGELGGDRRCYRVQDLKLIDENHALVYFEEDFTLVRVHFYLMEKKYIFRRIHIVKHFSHIRKYS